MTRLHFAVTVNAPKRKVQETMLGDDSYRLWTAAFAPGCHYEYVSIEHLGVVEDGREDTSGT